MMQESRGIRKIPETSDQGVRQDNVISFPGTERNEALTKPEMSPEETTKTMQAISDIDTLLGRKREELSMAMEAIAYTRSTFSGLSGKGVLLDKLPWRKKKQITTKTRLIEDLRTLEDLAQELRAERAELLRQRAKLIEALPEAERNEILARDAELKRARSHAGLSDKHGERGFLSLEQLAVFNEVFGEGNLEESPIPRPEDLTDAYFQKMYPERQSTEDTKKGLTRFQPRWWNKQADKGLIGDEDETWGEAFSRSMKKQIEDFFEDTIAIYSETIQKPNYTGGKQLYGCMDGAVEGKDPLLPIIKKIFERSANRFDHTCEDLETKFLPAITKHINKTFQSKGIVPPKFRVILQPAILFNEQTVNRHPSNSKTTTWEWTSTIFYKQDNTDSGRRLSVGHSDDGGAGSVGNVRRGYARGNGGFRLAVLLER